jgi:hypothetical protein
MEHGLPAPVRLDFSVGDESDNTASTTAFAKILDELKPTGLDYRFTVYRGENHNSVRLVSFPAGLYNGLAWHRLIPQAAAISRSQLVPSAMSRAARCASR